MTANAVETKSVGKNYWQEGEIVVFPLDSDQSTYAQMLGTSHLRFFDLFFKSGHEKGADLNHVAILFTVPVLAIAKKGTKPKVVKNGVVPSAKPLETTFIYPKMSFGRNSVPWLGGSLVDMTGIQGSGGWNAPVIKEDLNPSLDRSIILSNELVNMWSPEDLINRLMRFKESGVNVDQLKYKIFPDLKVIETPDDHFR